MKQLLVVVDMQHDFVEGSLGTKEAKSIVPRVVEKIRTYEASGDEVIYTMDTHFEDYFDTLEGQKLPVMHCLKGTKGWERHEAISRFAGRCFEKNTFGSMDCASYVVQGGYESIQLVGLCTDICVISNALLLKAMLPETPICVDGSCCAGVTTKSHQRALEAMKMCQIDII